MHLRNRDGRTPLFLAAEAGIERNVELLKKSGAHLHADEVDLAILLLKKAQEASDGNNGGNNGGTNNGNGDANGNGNGNLNEARVRCWKVAGL